MQSQHRVGQQFGNYRLTRLLGQGGYAEVYLAQNVLLNNLQLAIKILAGTSLSKKQREEFLNEARTVANLQRLSPHIVQIHDFGIQPSSALEDGGTPYLAMEYAPEGTLRMHYPHGSKMPLERIMLYVKQIAEALQCAHDQEPAVIHCDVKPENMLLRTHDHLLLSDFGIAIIGKTSTQQRVPTRDMAIIGTATYIAPERLSSKTTDRASDQYSLGVVVYEWLSGSPPFQGLDMEICYKHMTEPPPPFSRKENPHITPEIEAVVLRALKKQPTERYPSITAFALALEQAILTALARNRAPRQAQLPAPAKREEKQPQSAQRESNPNEDKTMIAPVRPARKNPVQATPPQSETLARPVPQAFDQSQVAPTILPIARLPAPQHPLSPYDEQTQAESIIPEPLLPQHIPSQTLPASLGSLAHALVTPLPVRTGSRGGPGEFFAISPSFLHDPRTSLFIYSGILCNVLSAIALGLLHFNFQQLFAALLFSLLTFVLSILCVARVLATFFSLLVALYWLVIGWSIGSALVAPLHLHPILPPLFTGFIFFGASLILNLWYIARKIL